MTYVTDIERGAVPMPEGGTDAPATSVGQPKNRLELQGSRFYFVDSLRGIAAILVLVFHIWNNAGLGAAFHTAPHWVDAAFMSCGSSVDMFFVISGFVIAYSIRGITVTSKTAINFALRRQVRLDPPYWAATCGVLILTYIAARKTPDIVHFPPIRVIAANLFYLQGILGLPSIDRVAWTLCLEVQFYILFIALLWLAQRTSRPAIIAAFAVTALAAVSLASTVVIGPTAWFITTWYLFALGALCCWGLAGQTHVSLPAVLSVLIISSASWRGGLSLSSLFGPLTAVGILTVGRLGHLHDWLRAPLFQYFATISYSLYLVHFDVVSLVFRAGSRISGKSPLSAMMWSVAAAFISIALAHCLWRLVERPSKRLASQLKPQKAVISHA